MSDVRASLDEYNPWWRGPWELEYREREVFTQIQRFYPRPQILALTGLRRVGKTTLLLRSVQEALHEGMDPRDVLYFSFDDAGGVKVREVLQGYEAVTGRDVRIGKHLVLLDEIQKVEGWSEQMKVLHDLYRGRVKFLLSGSESLFLRKGMRESLAGRMFEFRVDPLTFPEFLTFVSPASRRSAPSPRELPRLFPTFMRTLGLPELATSEAPDRAFVSKYVHQNLVERVLYRDLTQVLGRLNVPLLETLVNLVTEEPGQVLLLDSLARDIGVSRQTLASSLRILENSFLLRKLYNYSTSRRKTERKLKRYYPTLPSTDLLFRNDPQAQSLAFENTLVNTLGAEFFWRDAQKHEVDIVLPGPPPMALEVKYGRVDIEGVQAFMRRFKAAKGKVLTWDEDKTVPSPQGPIEVTMAARYLIDTAR